MPYFHGSQEFKRQHIWLELLKDYDVIINYHLGKANAVAGALSQKTLSVLRALNTRLMLVDDDYILSKLKTKPTLLQ
ncbi:RNA-directed DNA polymerase-like protein [Gossypium australe]|uniref:RNA-directed DNA polymerase-like protein n=1 Tax=Gossypium australe TaxID=47621 RepID=A0A5B6WH20_9ROSI|nr:RNA-directed DNA polymerase-like protein [Gossypium australe]